MTLSMSGAYGKNAFDYSSYAGLPPLAGITGFQEAIREGLSVEESVKRLKRYHYAFRRLTQIFVSRIPSEPIYELKLAFSLHAHLCAEHVTALQERVAEMREPPLGLEKTPDARLEIFFDEILSTPDTKLLLIGLYSNALPALQACLERHVKETNPLADAPSVRLCRFALLEVQDMLEFGKAALHSLEATSIVGSAEAWLKTLDQCLSAAGGLDGSTKSLGEIPQRTYSAQPKGFEGVPKRDKRFSDPFNMGVHAEAFLYDDSMPADAKVLMMYYKRLREIDVPEVIAGIVAETMGKPWGFYRAMIRQLWDEARHAMMGEVGFVKLGIDWPKHVRINKTWSYQLNTKLGPKERHAVLYFVEQGLMTKTGKRFEWEIAGQSNDRLSSLFQDYDWADEVLHARIGRDWLVSDLGSMQDALELGEKSWTRTLVDWNLWKQQGLTEHYNWWPDLYRAYCDEKSTAPDPHVLSYSKTYEEYRADLRQIDA
jgi:hypothetical protein